jgi:hypothetical protein
MEKLFGKVAVTKSKTAEMPAGVGGATTKKGSRKIHGA